MYGNLKNELRKKLYESTNVFLKNKSTKNIKF